MILGATSLVLQNNENEDIQLMTCSNKPLVPYYYRCRNCDNNLTTNTPASQYQRQKLIQKTVRVPSSIYTMNLASLSTYQQAIPQTHNVCWNQMSDRIVPHIQNNIVASGGQYTTSSTKHSITRMRPGSMSPGGKGVDIKHNSYDRRLNRLKGKAVLRRGIIPPDYGAPIPFNRSYPIYGGKTIKTNIINNCNCPISFDSKNNIKPSIFPNDIYNVKYKYFIGQEVYAKSIVSNCFVNGIIVSINNNTYNIKMNSGNIETKCENELLPYFPCVCDISHCETTSELFLFICSSNGINIEQIQQIMNNYFDLGQ